jgi:hypothetical protein
MQTMHYIFRDLHYLAGQVELSNNMHEHKTFIKSQSKPYRHKITIFRHKIHIIRTGFLKPGTGLVFQSR